MESVDRNSSKNESLLVAGNNNIQGRTLQITNYLESIIDDVLHDFLIRKKLKVSGLNEVCGARGARGLLKYMQGPDILVYETDTSEGDIAVHRTDFTEGDSTEGEERNKSFWSNRKYLILAISLISLLLIALTVGVSIYFGLHYGKHESEGNCEELEQKKILLFFSESADPINSTSPFPGKYCEDMFENQTPIIPQTHRI